MPQYADPSFLLDKIAQVNAPAAEQTGLTLHDLMTKSQSGDLDLQQKQQMLKMMSDPDYLSLLSSFLAPGGAGPSALGGPGAGAVASMFGRYPAAAGAGISQITGLAEKQADIEQKRAGAGKSIADTQKEYLAQAGHMADSVLALADKDGIVPPDKYVAVVRAANAMGVLRAFSQPPPQPGTPEATEFLKTMRAMTPSDIAQAGYRTAQTQNIPQELQLKWRQQAFAEAEKLGGKAFQDPNSMEWFAQIQDKDAQGLPIPGALRVVPLKIGPSSSPPVAGPTPGYTSGPGGVPTRVNYSGNDFPSFLEQMAADMRKQREQTTAMGPPSPTAGVDIAPKPAAPAVAAAPPAVASAAAAAGPTVGPYGGVKTGPSQQEKEISTALATGIGTHIAELTTKASAASQVQAIIQDLRNTEAEGIYSGGIAGTDYFRRFAGIAAAMGVLKPEQIDKLANTTTWNAEAITLLAQAVKQFAGPRVAAAELGYLEPSKVNLLMTPEGREKLYQSLYRVSARSIQEAQQADAHLKAGNHSLANFTPKYTDVKIPPPVVSDLPKLGSKDKGVIAVGDDGTKQFWNGYRWVPAPADAMLPR